MVMCSFLIGPQNDDLDVIVGPCQDVCRDIKRMKINGWHIFMKGFFDT